MLNKVLKDYKFATIGELNAVLNQFNVAADIGSPDSRIRENQGTLYRVLDKDGNRVGVPIKASDFHFKPTQKNLLPLFETNETLRAPNMARMKNSIDFALYSRSKLPITKLFGILEKDGIKAVTRQNDEGMLYGITYIDHRTGCVFNGSALGKQYSAKGIGERCAQDVFSLHQQKAQMLEANISQAPDRSNILQTGISGQREHEKSATDALPSPVKDDGYVPGQIRSSKRRKRKQFSQSL